MLDVAIRHAKLERVRFIIVGKERDNYQLYSPNHRRKMIRLEFLFYNLVRLPECHDILYVPDMFIREVEEGLHFGQFDTQIGSPCAREPHDFLQNPEGFLILEYEDGDTVLLEEVYG
ncbi:MAG: hypothetical protein IJD60_00390 [Clostridia bacterium]|nr:hypothetical protein [Clostridia bacterium]